MGVIGGPDGPVRGPAGWASLRDQGGGEGGPAEIAG